ncbi:hypothetical protein Mal4_39780 [Maioricimonas rarisocia]|uniref:Uncharacterized protein n=1 Tax=Maioricimonas rarisocia TaxID=2528026 RepID=A0A517ZAW1_9PLAN|nr:hypothetical protein Mal4_39780 [Maioricimonas rarisocia]
MTIARHDSAQHCVREVKGKQARSTDEPQPGRVADAWSIDHRGYSIRPGRKGRFAEVFRDLRASGAYAGNAVGTETDTRYILTENRVRRWLRIEEKCS